VAARAFARVPPIRAKVSLVFVCALALALAARLGVVQVHDGPRLARAALAQHDVTVDDFARRGTIYDRDGGVLVRSLASESIYAVPPSVIDAHAAEKLAPVLHLPVAAIAAALHDKAQFRWLARKVSHETAQRVQALRIAGIQMKAEETGRRFVASGRLASTVIGFTGTDENGLDGLEYAFDGLLRGTPGSTQIEADQFGRAIPFGASHVVDRAVSGRSVITTLDPYLQFEAERLLRDDVKRWQAKSGTAIVMDPWTGELLAVANIPDFDPAHFAAFSSDSWRDRAISDAYEPGSTFKLITAAAALESRKVGPDAQFPARDELEVGGRTIHNAEDGLMAAGAGTESVEDIIAYSHNVGAAEIGMAIGKRSMYRTLRAFGFGDPTRIELAGENPGIVDPPESWSGSQLATISFGHGISTTPLALVRAYAAIANGGLLMRPRIVHALGDPDGNVLYRYPPEVERRAISARTARTLMRYLRAVVARGTGNPTARVAGYTTAGKTGTAQVVENGRYEPGEYVASFVGMVPAQRPRYVILVKVDRPRGAIYGSVVAAPVFAELARIAMLHAGVMPAAPPPRLVRRSAATKAGR
jgi:cell division protein FtsI/penicillin-binding protein 2